MRRKQIFAIMLIIMCLLTESVPVWAEETENAQESIDAVGTDYITSEDGEWQYQKLEDAEGEPYIDIYEYTGTDEILTVPSELDGITVRSMGGIVFYNNTTVKEVIIPESIETVSQSTFKTASALEKITIENPTLEGFHSIDGVFYNGTELVAYPAAKEGSCYIIPEGTTDLLNGAFYRCSNLTKIIVPSTVVYYRTGAFSRSEQPIDIVLKGTSTTAVRYLMDACWEMAVGTKYLVKTEEYKDTLLSKMTLTDVYKGSTDTMAVEVAEPIPATSLTFTDGSTEQYVTVSYTDTGYIGDPVNRFELYSIYQQAPADTTENVTWSLVSADTCPDASNYNDSNPNYYVCQVTSGGTIVTYAGGEAVLKATDESGHEITLHVTVYSPMESCELYGYNNIETPCIEIESEEDDKWNTVFAKIRPFKSYAWNQEVLWESLNPDIAEVSSTGSNTARVKGLYPGDATLKATINDDGTLVEKTIEITVQGSVEECTIDPIPAQTYYGNKQGTIPQAEYLLPEVTLRYNGQVMSKDDYEVSYGSQRVGTDNKIWITGKNHLYGETSTSFEIIVPVIDNGNDSEDTEPSDPPADNDNDNDSSKDDGAEDTNNPADENTQKPGESENGKEETPADKPAEKPAENPADENTQQPEQGAGSIVEEPVNPTVDGSTQQPVQNEITGVEDSYTKTYGAKSFTLKASGPESVTYSSSNKKVVTIGSTTGKVTIKGIGKAVITVRSGSLTKKVTITVIPKKASSVKAKAQAKSIKVSWKADKTVTGYQIQYATDSKFAKGNKTITIKKNKTTSYVIKSLKSKKKYYVRIRAYKTVNGKKYYSDWSKAVSAKVK